MKRNTKKRGNPIYAFIAILLCLCMITACSSPASEEPASAANTTEEKAESTEKAEVVWKEMDVLKASEASDIESISYSFYGEEGETSGTAVDPTVIEDIYLRLCNISVGKAVNMGIEDASLYVTVQLADQELKFHFEDDYVDLEDSLHEAEHVSSLRTYLWKLAEESAEEPDEDTAEEPEDAVTEENAEEVIAEEIPENAEELDERDYRVFSSEIMNFSFLYNAAHTAYVSESGAALLAINGDKARTGLFVSVVDAENMPSIDQYLEEETFDAQMRYQNALASQPERQDLDIEGHSISGIVFTYSTPSGETILSSVFVEVRDGKYIFYKTRGINGGNGDELVAMGAALVSLEFDANAYGPSDAVPGSLPSDEFDTSQ